jgi:hypothetical protein
MSIEVKTRLKIKRKKIGALHLKDVVYRSGTPYNVFRQNQEKGRSGRRGYIFASCTSRGVQTLLPTSGTAEESNQIVAEYDGKIEECSRCTLPGHCSLPG